MFRPVSIAGGLLLVLCFGLTVARSQELEHAQVPEVVSAPPFLRRERPAYANYALQNYVNYPNHTAPYLDTPRAFYGQGNYLVTGYPLYEWNEIRTPGRSTAAASSSTPARVRGHRAHGSRSSTAW